MRSAENWDLGFVKCSRNRAEYEAMVRSILEASQFMQVCGLTDLERLKTVDLFICHEAMHLDYEEALTRPFNLASQRVPGKSEEKKAEVAYGNLGAHFIWIGDRTRQLDDAHVEYMRARKPGWRQGRAINAGG